jgi:hypothetical protein
LIGQVAEVAKRQRYGCILAKLNFCESSYRYAETIARG